MRRHGGLILTFSSILRQVFVRPTVCGSGCFTGSALQSGRPGTSYWLNIVEQRRPSVIFITLQSNLEQMFRGVLLGVLFQRCLTYVRRLCEQF